MYRSLARIFVFVLTLTFGTGLAFGFTYSVDGAPAGSVPIPYNDGTLITCTGPGTFSSTNVLSGYPIDAIHIGAPLKNVVNRLPNGSLQVVSPIFFSIDDGSPFPVGAANASADEIYVSNKLNSGPPNGAYGTATIGELTSGASILPATEPNLNLGLSGKAYNDNVDALSLRNYNSDTDLVFFSIDDLVPFVPNSAASMQTRDVFVRFTSGGVAKVIDGATDIGLADGSKAPFTLCDDLASLILVEVDNNPSNNKFVTVLDPNTQQQVRVDLGDGILFTVDSDLPGDFMPSLHPYDVYFSALDGSAPIKVIDGQLGLGLNPSDQIDALAAYGSEGSSVPEPGTLLLLGTGLMTFAGMLRRKNLKN